MSGPDGQTRPVPAEGCEPYVACIAQVWHWPLSDMLPMTVPELMHWYELAKQLNPPTN